MTFQPRMQNRISGFSIIGGLNRREWNGVVADVWDVECVPHAGGYYIAEDPRMFIVLDARGGGNCRVKLAANGKGAVQNYHRQALSYIPAGMELWTDVVDIHYIRHLDLHFDVDALGRRLKEDLDAAAIETPRLMFQDERFLTLAGLIAAECLNPQPLHDLYGDSLTVALFIDLMKIGKRSGRKRSQLAAWQLRRAVDFIEENFARNVRLEELAGLTGLSQSHFSHAFKASTGVAPHQWHMNARVERAKQMLLRSDAPLTSIAAETGFADQAHFTRVFRKAVGTTPALWKKSHTA
ncbi:helix-turn-helix transcriptional regulator [Sinorhizobium meliloti WSM1022]|jgi:AraC-like DNA-binding protein|uniref:AraC family transcriptional regulator n=1 Tax=Rhizobium meliloti TaxID=382 RepID=UPI00040DC8FA|nr:AraC family transcriptional regulator [Sinorhizobium meliloti]ASQ03434.1 AraC family transcriptional regulator [Sinorhizobium meliloti]MCO6424174.1 AraC family transcriptional regulator [Sinorhizobium meliloti]MDW9408367.1 helix-turn-helix domain-containing protein [Sinorhizobium meliloti]MDW9442601.1 helix-turn-helix domain-containing protein [Sinorhizobium meliloti]MDW9453270.1 helix-turn-helix domain-containing protein [Sinorhizobium meliloti]